MALFQKGNSLAFDFYFIIKQKSLGINVYQWKKKHRRYVLSRKSINNNIFQSQTYQLWSPSMEKLSIIIALCGWFLTITKSPKLIFSLWKSSTIMFSYRKVFINNDIFQWRSQKTISFSYCEVINDDLFRQWLSFLIVKSPTMPFSYGKVFIDSDIFLWRSQ